MWLLLLLLLVAVAGDIMPNFANGNTAYVVFSPTKYLG
jgi:hypothetical protein